MPLIYKRATRSNIAQAAKIMAELLSSVPEQYGATLGAPIEMFVSDCWDVLDRINDEVCVTLQVHNGNEAERAFAARLSDALERLKQL